MELMVADVGISQDADGRYCLNDLHRAAGGDQKHRPKYWLENKQTVELIEELKLAREIPPILAKQGLGTFVARELVYAYGMWISPAFNLRVIRAYDAVMSARISVLPQTFSEALLLAANQARQLEEAQPKLQAFDTFLSCKNAMTFNEAAKVLGTGQNRLFQFCREAGMLIEGGAKHNLPYQEYADRNYFEVREVVIQHSDWTERKSQTLITTEGMEYVRKKMFPPAVPGAWSGGGCRTRSPRARSCATGCCATRRR